MNVSDFSATLDARRLSLEGSYSRLQSAFGLLGRGAMRELISEQEPEALKTRLLADVPSQFAWEVLTRSPDTWRVAVTRLQDGHGRTVAAASAAAAERHALIRGENRYLFGSNFSA